MPRLRTMLITETSETGRTRTRDILILDGLTLEECETLGQAGSRPDGIPPILGFPFSVDLAEGAAGELLELDTSDHFNITIDAAGAPDVLDVLQRALRNATT